LCGLGLEKAFSAVTQREQLAVERALLRELAVELLARTGAALLVSASAAGVASVIIVVAVQAAVSALVISCVKGESC
jgi:hypothetical protein